jgi:hypothetical protein
MNHGKKVKAMAESADMIFMGERRSEVRMLCADMVEISWKGLRGKTLRTTALLEDIAPSGACLQFETPVPIGMEIQWEASKQEFKGRVCYCVYREIGYFVGVEFDSGSTWSKKKYKPLHLLDLEKLMVAAKK